ncbi:MAG: ParB/RepB/Spo0J family partition protein [Syntrophomonadaceae bacterium]|jgi:ParB family chromosome partitioning protein|nr:ParB/RepB/Spo0J family partition protein [Syntrophomonadaceae bacterium]MDH7496896.1 ParB/RepB/Spo0J family partition protein [Syntrophomonadaceae bacterium]
MGRKSLGKGLEALIGVAQEETNAQRVEVHISQLVRKPDQPRVHFDEETLAELAASIREHGVLQPILVRPLPSGHFEVVAGERRLRAAERAGMETVPVIIKELGDAQAAEISLVENLHRADLNPVEEALAYRQMIQSFGYTQEQLAQRIGKSRAHVANTLRLLKLTDGVLKMLAAGLLTAGHGRAILAQANSPREQVQMARRLAAHRASVRQAEQRVGGWERAGKAGVDPDVKNLQERLQDRLGTRVVLHRGKRGGKLEIFFYGDEELERLLELLGL